MTLADAPGPPGSVCTEGSNQCRLPVCSWPGSCQPLAGGAASLGCGRRLGLITLKKKEREFCCNGVNQKLCINDLYLYLKYGIWSFYISGRNANVLVFTECKLICILGKNNSILRCFLIILTDKINVVNNQGEQFDVWCLAQGHVNMWTLGATAAPQARKTDPHFKNPNTQLQWPIECIK